MKISKDSWHYKLIAITTNKFEPQSNSLCIYFWQVVWSALKIVGIVTTTAFVVMFVVFCLTYPVTQFGWVEGNILNAILSVAVWCFVLLLIKDALTDYLPHDSILLKDVMPKRDEERKKSSILAEYLKAKKAKVCPTLEFED